MHGRVQSKGEGFRNLRRSNSQRMQSVPPLVTDDSEASVVGNCSSRKSVATAPSGGSFFQDGRQISVGDCALFKPLQDSPPFIGLIRWLKAGKENNLQLGVSWLYRSAELNLAKGFFEEGAPNEVFYSFHKDEIPAASLLHPCKVAFLPKGVHLPTGASSLVCRRVYDITKKRLYWLTDQDFIDERQEEVDELLRKTRTEMHAMLQSDGRSPKQANGPNSATQPKPAIDSGQNSGNSLNSQVRGKKRGRGDHSSDPIKRERSIKSDDADSLQCKIENNLKSEISLITEKGGVVDLEGVDKLIQLMQPVRTERKMDLSSRSMLAGVMAATDKVDCLNRFVQLRGLPVLDEWLQDVRKGRIVDGNNAKDRDKSVEEFLLVLLRALDKLPVNLHALQMCNIGKSVNHLRSHKNLEIQRKARALVDAWKKRVEAEMISNDAKSGSTQGVTWPSKSRLPEASHGGGVRTPSGSDVSIKNSSTQNSASKTISSKSSHGDANVKSASSPRGTGKQTSPPSIGQENHPRSSAGVTEDVPQIKEDRGNRADQSQNCSPSYSLKDDAKSTTHKMSSSGSRNKKSSGFTGISTNASQKEINTNRSSSCLKVAALEKRAHSTLSSERIVEGAVSEGTNHKLIVKIPSRVRSPPQGSSAGLVDDSTSMSSRVSSPLLSDKNEQLERVSEDRIEAYQCNASSDVNADSREDCDLKDASTGSADGARPHGAVPDEGQSMAAVDSERVVHSLMSQHQRLELHSSSFSPMNALIESCVKYSEVNMSPSLEDDGGMNLLASVATREMSRSDLVSPVDSTEIKIPAAEDVCTGDVGESKSSPEDLAVVDQNQNCNDAEKDGKKKYVATGGLRSEDSSHVSKHVQLSNGSEDIPSERRNVSEISSRDMSNNTETKLMVVEKLNEIAGTNPSAESTRESEPDEKMLKGNTTSSNLVPDDVKSKSGRFDDADTEDKVASDHKNADSVKPIIGVAAGDCKNDSNGQNNTTLLVGKPVSSAKIHESTERLSNEKQHHNAYEQEPLPEGVNDAAAIESNAKHGLSRVTKSGSNFHEDEGIDVADESQAIDMENKVTINHTSTAERQRLVHVDREATDQMTDLRGTKSASIQSDGEEDCASTAADVSCHTAGTSDVDGKMKFDLNEGLSADEGKSCDPFNLMSACATSVQMINSLYPVTSTPHVHSSSITVASAAKGPFVPPDDLLRSKGELGWKGSAATSAFRPAEPRRALETTQVTSTMSCSDASTSNKSGRFPLDIDLNVPDEGLVEEMTSRNSALAVDSISSFSAGRALSINEGRSSRPVLVRTGGGLDLDLNAIDETNDNGNCSTSTNRNAVDPAVHAKQLVAGLPSGDVRRGFDLNDGPGVDEGGAEIFLFNQQVKGGSGIPPHQPPSSGLRMNPPGLGSFSSSWFPAGNVYTPMTIPSVLPDRRDHHPFPVLQPSPAQRPFASSGTGPFAPEPYRGSVLPSSPAMNFQSGPFHFPVFPFGTSFPVPSTTSPASYGEPSTGPRMFAPPPLHHQQLLGPVGAISSQFPRPYVVNLPESSSNSNGILDSTRKWSRPGLDLNTGPGAAEIESNREEMFTLTSGQQSVGSSRALTEEQARIYSASNGVLKRKEPEGGMENESFRFKHNSWQ